ncbi:MAG: hypothetical protein ACT4OJ_11025 [Bacteroidota bacterium]
MANIRTKDWLAVSGSFEKGKQLTEKEENVYNQGECEKEAEILNVRKYHKPGGNPAPHDVPELP